MPPPFRYAERPPTAALAPWFLAYWEFSVREGAPPEHYVPPDGCTSLTMIVGGPARGALLASGPWLEPLAVPVEAGSRYVGIRLKAGVAGIVLGVDPSSLRNSSIPADAMLGPLAGALRDAVMGTSDFDGAAAVLDDIWSREVSRFTEPDPLVMRAVERVIAANGELSIATLARDVNTSERTLLRRFKAATGLTPKQFARIRRLLAAAWQVVDGRDTWSEIAARAGYADQPHLHHDVVDLTGLRPDDFGDRIRSTEHDGVNR